MNSSECHNCMKILLLITAAVSILSLVSCSSGTPNSSESTEYCIEPSSILSPGIKVYKDCQPPYAKDKLNKHAIQLINNSDASDPTWQELKSFLIKDETNTVIYSEDYLCGHFCERLHNNAEDAGIRSAVAVIEVGLSAPHALNAFITTDKGLVYIDCTGPEFRAAMSAVQWQYEQDHPSMYDKVAYVQIGKPLGFLSIEINPPFSYEMFELRVQPNPWQSRGISQNVEIFW